MIKLKNYLKIIITASCFFLLSCSSGEYKKIPLEEVNPKLSERGSLIVKDILNSFTHEDGARSLLNNDYVTPMVHGRIVRNEEKYKDAYFTIFFTIGKPSKYSLFQVLDKGLIKTLRYKLISKNSELKFIELALDINKENNLADFYLYITTKDGKMKRVNYIPEKRK